MEASDSLRQKKINFFCPILDTSTCVSPYLLLQYGESRDESENTPVPHGAFGHRCDHEHIYASGTGGCQRRDDPYGRIKRSQARTGKDNWRKTDYSKDVSGGVIWRKMKNALLTVMVGRVFFLWRIIGLRAIIIYRLLYFLLLNKMY